jgi:hypothetical protein
MMPLAFDLISTLVMGSILPVATTDRVIGPRSTVTSREGSIAVRGPVHGGEIRAGGHEGDERRRQGRTCGVWSWVSRRRPPPAVTNRRRRMFRPPARALVESGPDMWLLESTPDSPSDPALPPAARQHQDRGPRPARRLRGGRPARLTPALPADPSGRRPARGRPREHERHVRERRARDEAAPAHRRRAEGRADGVHRARVGGTTPTA